MKLKKKKLSKIIKNAVCEGVKEYNRHMKSTGLKEKRHNDELFSESTEDSKTKIRNLITRLFQHRDELDYNFSESTINIYSPYEDKKMTKGSINSNTQFSIEIIKEVGFIINFNERRILMRDITLYDEMKPKIKEISNEINQNNFTELYFTMMKENGLNRESNLDDLLNHL